MEKRSLKGIRAELNLTQAELAKELGLSTHTYQRYEEDGTRIPFKIVVKLADIAGIQDLRMIKV